MEEQTFAIVQSGGRQYKATVGKKIIVEASPASESTLKVGSSLELSDVLVVSRNNGAEFTIGNPMLKGTKVKTKVLAFKRGPKLVIFKKRRRQRYQKKQGHRGRQVELLVEAIVS